MVLKYLHTDGTGKVYYGKTVEGLASADFCQHVFGELERPLQTDEQINPQTGEIEPRPKLQSEIDGENRRSLVRQALSALDNGTATSSELQAVVAALVRETIGEG